MSRALLLGLGGGAVIRQLRRHIGPDSITAVELDPVHLEVARRFFAVAGADLELVLADARDWLRDDAGSGFDLIVDDLFGHGQGPVQRAVAVSREWMRLLSRRLNADGVLVTNYPDAADFKQHSVPRRFAGGVGLSTPGYGNFVTALCDRPVTARSLRRCVRSGKLFGAGEFVYRASTLRLGASGGL